MLIISKSISKRTSTFPAIERTLKQPNLITVSLFSLGTVGGLTPGSESGGRERMSRPWKGSELSCFSQTSHEEVSWLINSLPNKQSKMDPIPTWLLNELSELITPFLVSLFNKSLASGEVPSLFKVAQVSPVIKKPTLNPNQPSSFRPISNLTVISKLLERLVLKRVLTYLEANALLPPTQSAYRRHQSTVVSDIRMAIDRGNVVILLLGMSAAFDTVDHNILIDRLDRTFAICQIALDWLRSYLKNSQLIVTASADPVTQNVSSGVP